MLTQSRIHKIIIIREICHIKSHETAFIYEWQKLQKHSRRIDYRVTLYGESFDRAWERSRDHEHEFRYFPHLFVADPSSTTIDQHRYYIFFLTTKDKDKPFWHQRKYEIKTSYRAVWYYGFGSRWCIAHLKITSMHFKSPDNLILMRNCSLKCTRPMEESRKYVRRAELLRDCRVQE